MVIQHKELRKTLKSVAPKRAIEYVKSFELRPAEEYAIIECDIKGKSIVQVSIELQVSVETINNKRNSAYSKMADAINNGYNKKL